MNYCSKCGALVTLEIPPGDDRPRYICRGCGEIHYQNPKIVVGCLPQWEDRILLCRRNIEPQKGMWTLPAGYLENGETVSDGARRETWEESGAMVEDLLPYLLFDVVHVNQIYLMFRARLQTPEFKTTQESAEVALLREEEIPWDRIAFRAIENTLRRYFYDRPCGQFPFRIRRIQKKPAPE
ncbi:MAG: NUDIX hydrolase [Desulfobacteraceae bacterium]|nr:MAG: NUDIX hydrolase [Desulfobacteraceae bacterium]